MDLEIPRGAHTRKIVVSQNSRVAQAPLDPLLSRRYKGVKNEFRITARILSKVDLLADTTAWGEQGTMDLKLVIQSLASSCLVLL